MSEAMVKYIGTADARRITAQEWKGVGVHDMGTTVWNRANGFSVPLSSITDGARPYIEADERLVIVDQEATGTTGGASDDHINDAPIRIAQQRPQTDPGDAGTTVPAS